MAFRTVTKLDDFIKTYMNEVSVKEEKEITIIEAMTRIGEYADVSWNTIKLMKNKDATPSLPVALRIAEFFNVTVNDIWTVEYFEQDKAMSTRYIPKKVKDEDREECLSENCNRKAIARGMCNKCYQTFRNKNKELFNKERLEKCKESNCENPHHAKGLCVQHYNKKYSEKRKRK